MLALGVSAQREAVADCALPVVGDIESGDGAENIAVTGVRAAVDGCRIDGGAGRGQRGSRGRQIAARDLGRGCGLRGGTCRARAHGPRCRRRPAHLRPWCSLRPRRRRLGRRRHDNGRKRGLRINRLGMRGNWCKAWRECHRDKTPNKVRLARTHPVPHHPRGRTQSVSGAGAPPETAAAFDPTRNVPCSVANATDDKVTWYDVNKKTSYWTRDACGCGVAVTLRRRCRRSGRSRAKEQVTSQPCSRASDRAAARPGLRKARNCSSRPPPSSPSLPWAPVACAAFGSRSPPRGNPR
jgi:hypothetical protein